MVILDTDHLSLLEQAESAAGKKLRARLQRLPPDDVATTVITYEEQTRGWLSYVARARGVTQQVEAYSRLLRHLSVFQHVPVLPFDDAAAVEYQRLRRVVGIRIGTMDLRIAAIARSKNAVLATRNVRDFRQVPDLQIEDWTQ